MTRCPVAERGSLTRCLGYFKIYFNRKWIPANFKEERFLEKNGNRSANHVEVPIISINTPSRHQKDSSESSGRNKHGKTRELRQLVTPEELTFAPVMSHRATGNPDVADLKAI
ncbi:hypothetical protein JTB14_007324 [Gonioctena quinquepunctata]|nr:hypothetical protein JTB14_007324 [Gonioctena quinquepunctata]